MPGAVSPLLLHDAVEGVLLEGGRDLFQGFFVVMLEKFHHLREARRIDLDDFDVLRTAVVAVVVVAAGVLHGLGQTRGLVRPGSQNDEEHAAAKRMRWPKETGKCRSPATRHSAMHRL